MHHYRDIFPEPSDRQKSYWVAVVVLLTLVIIILGAIIVGVKWHRSQQNKEFIYQNEQTR